MEVKDPGHKYALQNNKHPGTTKLVFYKDEEINGDGYPGTTNQEVCRVLIDRIKFLDKQKECSENRIIINHLRDVIYLHEYRAARLHFPDDSQILSKIEALIEKHGAIEHVPIKENGHIL